jgi:hypothetical protein
VKAINDPLTSPEPLWPRHVAFALTRAPLRRSRLSTRSRRPSVESLKAVGGLQRHATFESPEASAVAGAPHLCGRVKRLLA